MEFIVSFPMTIRRHDSSFVVVDTLKKSAHFVPMCTMYQVLDIDTIFVRNMVRLHGISIRIIYDRGLVFIGRFWNSFQEAFETQLNFITTYHPEKNKKIDKTDCISEDILRIYVVDQHKYWEDLFPLVYFSYKHSYQSMIKIALLELIYGKPC
jgi:hypothetical protein